MDNIESNPPPSRDTWACWISIGVLLVAIFWVHGYASLPGVAIEHAAAVHFTKVDATREYVVSAITPTMGGVWVGTLGSSLFDLESGVADPSAIGKSLPNHITAILAGELGIFVGTQDSGLFLLSPATSGSATPTAQPITLPGTKGPGHVTALARNLGRLWVGTTHGLFAMDASGWFAFHPPTRFGTPLGDSAITALYADVRGVLWIGTQSGLYESAGGELFRHSQESGLPADKILSISGDEDGLLVVGTQSGLAMHRDKGWVKDGVIKGKVSAVLIAGPSDDHEIWAAADDALWLKTTRTPFRQVSPVPEAANGLTSNHVTALAVGVDGLYVGTDAGLFRRDTPTQAASTGVAVAPAKATPSPSK